LEVVQQAFNLAYRFPKLQLAVRVYYRDTSAVVAPILQPLQALQNYRPGLLVTYISDNSAHGCSVAFADGIDGLEPRRGKEALVEFPEPVPHYGGV
jgi:hypothetical protein